MPSLTAPACPSYTSGEASQWMVSGDIPLPTIGQTHQAGPENTQSTTPTGTESQGQPTATQTKGAAPGSPIKEVQSMGLGLVGVLFGFFWWM